MQAWVIAVIVALAFVFSGTSLVARYPWSYENLAFVVFGIWFVRAYLEPTLNARWFMNVGWILSALLYFVSIEASSLATVAAIGVWCLRVRSFENSFLVKRPLVQLVFKNVFLIPFCLLVVGKIDMLSIGWSLAVFGSYLTFDFSRSDFLTVYKRQGALIAVALFFAMSSISAKSIGLQTWLTPMGLVAFASFFVTWTPQLVSIPQARRFISGVTVVSFFVHVLAPGLIALGIFAK